MHNLQFTACYIYLSLLVMSLLVSISSSLRIGSSSRLLTTAPRLFGRTRLFNSLPTSTQIENMVALTFEQEGVSSRATILLCVSAGADSMAMLHLLQALKQRLYHHLDLRVINFNHKARKESEEEAVFVKQWCSQYQLPFYMREFPEEERGIKSSFQNRARVWRQAESQAILKEVDNFHGKFVATAHHRDDQIETILMKVLTGAHITNLSAMKTVQQNYFKPLLSLHKSTLLEYLTANNYTWHEDASNLSRIYKRNKVRLDLIPLLEELAGGKNGLERRMMYLSKQSSEVADLLQTLEQRSIEVPNWKTRYLQDYYYTLEIPEEDRKKLLPIQLSRKIHKWVQTCVGKTIQSDVMEDIMALFDKLGNKKSVTSTISDEWDVVWMAYELRLMRRLHPSQLETTTLATNHNETTVSVEHPTYIKLSPGNQLLIKVPDTTVQHGLKCRLVADGDYLVLAKGSGVKRKIRDEFHKRLGLSSAERSRIMVVTDHEDHCLAAIYGDNVLRAGSTKNEAYNTEVQLSAELLFSST